jgi:peroxiredoxin
LEPTFAYSALPDNAPNDFAFRFEDHRAHNWYYVTTHTGSLHFDLQCGLLVSGTDDWVQGYPRKSKGTGTFALKSVRIRDAAFITQLGRESDIYFQATADYHRAASAAWKDAAQIAPFRQQAKKQLADARAHITLPLFADPLDELLAAHDGLVKEMGKESQEGAQRIAAVMNRPAASWQLRDLNGKHHQLSDYRGKVVLLDFWYRACGYCIDMMPQMKQVADDFKNEPVVVLGMNTDDDEKDAAFIAGKMGLNYPTLLAPDIPRAYGVEGYPTAILIDPEGIVREIRNGYSPRLREELNREIRALLPGRPAPTTPPLK